MRFRPVLHLTDGVLVQETRELSANDRGNTAQLLIHLGEIDRRKLYLAASYPSMYKYCIGEFLMTEDVAYKRIQAARVARKCPSILERIADGRLNLTSIVLLRPVLTRRNADRLLKAAEGMTKEEVKLLIVRSFPKPDLPTQIEPLPPAQSVGPVGRELVPEPVEFGRNSAEIGVFGDVPSVSLPAPVDPPRIAPLAPQRFGIQFTVGQAVHEKLRYVQQLLGHQVVAGDLAEVFERALDALIIQLEHKKFAATDRPQAQSRPSRNPRHIPSAVKREVWKRDGAQCTFKSDSGRRCEEKSGLEFDHVDPVARGGTATARNLRLRCRAHNQYEAERTFGVDFMRHKRENANVAASG
jgi:hypothetical protein